MRQMHAYRTHDCGQLRASDVGETVRLSGWVHRKRDHGQLLFIDLRDHYGLTQCVIDVDNSLFKVAEEVKLESVITIVGRVVQRMADTVNHQMPTGEIEVVIDEIIIQSK